MRDQIDPEDDRLVRFLPNTERSYALTKHVHLKKASVSLSRPASSICAAKIAVSKNDFAIGLQLADSVSARNCSYTSYTCNAQSKVTNLQEQYP